MRLLLAAVLAVSARAQTRLVDILPAPEASVPAIPGSEAALPASLPLESAAEPSALGPATPGASLEGPLGLSEAAREIPKEASQPLNALFDAVQRRAPSAVDASEAVPAADWSALDGVLSRRMGIEASEHTTRRLRRDVILTLRGEPGLPLETALERGFSKAHSLVPAEAERVPKILANYDDFRKLDIPWAEYRAEIEKVKGLAHPHPNRVYAVETNRPVTLLAAGDALWEKSPAGHWKPVERRLEWWDSGTSNHLMMYPDRWAVSALDRKRFHFFSAGQDVDMGDGLVVKALPAGLWRYDLPLLDGWRERLLRDVSSSKLDEEASGEAVPSPVRGEDGAIIGRRGRSIFSSGGPGVP